MTRRVVFVVLACALVASTATACGGGSGRHTGRRDSTTSTSTQAASAPVSWQTCPTQPALQCGSVEVPLDYGHSAGASIPIALARRSATEPSRRLGVLAFNPGGPGESGVQILPLVIASLPPAVLDRYDVVAFDARGAGSSGRVDCGTDPAGAASVVPVAEEGAPLPGTRFFTDMAHRCEAKYGARLGLFDTMNAARDLDRVRAALGVEKLSYLGLSYGTLLGAEYAQLFPRRVQAMVLDGAVVPGRSLADNARDEAPALEAALEHFFSQCVATSCPMAPNPAGLFDRVATRLAEAPLPAPGHGDDQPVTVGDLDGAALFALSVPAFGSGFPAAVVSADHGDGAPLRALSLGFQSDLDGTSLVDAMWTTMCEDAAGHPSGRDAGALARELAARYPRLGGYAVTYNLGGCVAWPASRVPATPVSAGSAPPIVVIGTTGDPNTPHDWAERLARELRTARLVTWIGWGHTWLLNGASDTCMRAVVSAYLVDSRAPDSGTRCS